MFIDNKINRRVIIIKKQIAIICSCLLVIVPILLEELVINVPVSLGNKMDIQLPAVKPNSNKEIEYYYIDLSNIELPIKETIANTNTETIEGQAILDAIYLLEQQKLEAEKQKEEVVQEPQKTLFYRDNIPLSKNLQNYIYELCLEYNIDYSIVFSLIYYESRFDIDAHNKSSNCRGLMQLSQKYYGKNCNLFDPYTNVKKGIALLASHYEDYNNYHKALMCYNIGGGAASSLFKKGVTKSTYSKNVIKKAAEYK